MKTKTINLANISREKLASYVALTNISSKHVDSYVSLVKHISTHKGEKKCIELMKLYQLWVRNWSLGIPKPELPWHKVSKSGIPKVLRPWKTMIMDPTVKNKRHINTIFGAVKCIRTCIDTNTDTITIDGIYDTDLASKICEYISNSRIPKLNVRKLDSFKLRSTAGPNGPAALTSLMDIQALASNIDILRKIVELSSTTWDRSVTEQIISYVQRCTPDSSFNTGVIRFLPDKAGKTRVICIADYWSQLALLPLHDALILYLKNTKTDCTYNHERLRSTLVSKTSQGCFVGTADSTAFTDRLPTIIQESVINKAFGASIGKLWTELLTAREYLVPDGRKIRYSVGQPIGIYSSWATATITHHYIVDYSANVVGVKDFTDYLILGDDIAIFNREVYDQYIKVMTSLGVSINPSKSTVSRRGAEMAKRFFYKGIEVTGVPLEPLSDLKKDPTGVLDVLSTLQDICYGPYTKSQVLRCTPPRFKGEVQTLLAAPASIGGFPDIIKDNTNWNWPVQIIERAFNKGKIESFVQAIGKLKELINSDKKPMISKRILRKYPALRHVPEDHPLVMALGERLIFYLSILETLDPEGSSTGEVCESDILKLMFPPVSEVYTHRTLARYRSHLKGNVMLRAVSLLESNDLSHTSVEDIKTDIFGACFDLATLRL